MIVEVKHGVNSKTFEFHHSIGDVVKIKGYGKRYADQEMIFERSKFLVNYSKDFNANNRFIETEYHKCDELYGNVEWKIVDIGYYEISRLNSLGSAVLVVRLTTRIKGEDLLFVYNNAYAKYLEVVRKSKKDMENAVINID